MFLGGKRMTFITNTHMMSDIIKLEAKGTLDPYELRIFNLPPVPLFHLIAAIRRLLI